MAISAAVHQPVKLAVRGLTPPRGVPRLALPKRENRSAALALDWTSQIVISNPQAPPCSVGT